MLSSLILLNVHLIPRISKIGMNAPAISTMNLLIGLAESHMAIARTKYNTSNPTEMTLPMEITPIQRISRNPAPYERNNDNRILPAPQMPVIILQFMLTRPWLLQEN